MFDFSLDTNIGKGPLKLKEIYDVLIIGAGPGAINSAIYAARNNLSVLIVSNNVGGQLLNTNIIDNYLGFYNISGESLSGKFLDHLNKFDVDQILDSLVTKIEKKDNLFNSKLNNGSSVKSKTVILASGGNPRKLNVEGENKLTGKGVSYCVICDGAFYKDKDVVVVGGGNSAIEAALDLSKIAKNVHIIQNLNKFTCDSVLEEKIKKSKNITYSLNSLVKQISGNDKLENVIYEENGKIKQIDADGIFIEIGIIPNSELVKDLVTLNKLNEVITNNDQETSLEGFYAIGDVTDFKYKQVITAVSQGAVAALNINNYINK